MTLTVLPKSIFGRVSVILLGLTPVFFCLGMAFLGFYDSLPAGRTILLDILSRPGVALPMLAGLVSGIAAFVTGMISIIRVKDRTVLVFVSTAIGLLILLFIVAEIAFPH